MRSDQAREEAVEFGERRVGEDDASTGAILNAVRSKKPGETIALTVIRNGQPIDLAVTIEPPPGDND